LHRSRRKQSHTEEFVRFGIDGVDESKALVHQPGHGVFR
jgi:hypothetical protein